MLRERRGLVLAVAAILQMGIPVSAQPEVTLGQIKKSLICLCDCNMTVDACQGAMDCQTAEDLAMEAGTLIDQGMDRTDILDRMVSRHGERILAAPTKRGFNLSAWIIPFLALGLGAFGIIIALKSWVGSRGGNSGWSDSFSSEAVDAKYQKKLEEVLRDLD